HRHGLFHVFFHVFDRGLLVWSEHEWKAVFKLILPRCVGGERVTADEFSFRVKTQKLVGHIAHRALGFGFCLLPAETAETIELWLMSFRARIALHEVETLDGNVELRFVGVVEQHELAGAWSKIE